MTAIAGATAASAATTFAPGDVVVYRVGTGTGALGSGGTAVFLDEYTPSGTLVQSVPLPTTASGSNKPLVASGSAASEGLLTLSADGRYLVATGYDAALGTSKVGSTASATVPRTVALVDGTGTVNSSTALTDVADANNVRSAVSADGSAVWVTGAAGGIRYAPVGTTGASTALTDVSTFKNFRQLEIVNGQLYVSADPTKASVTVATIGTGLPTSGISTPANLPFTTAPSDPYAFSMLTLGSGTAPDTVYVANLTAGAVQKFGLSSGSWVPEGSVAVSGLTGVTANDVNGTVTIFASAPTGISSITDASGFGGTLGGSATAIASAGTNKAFLGIAFAPGTVIGSGGTPPPPPVLPTIAPDRAGLPAALGDPTNPSLGLTVGDPNFTADQLTVTATSGNTTVAPQAGVSVSGTGATRTLSVTPASVGYSTITLKVTAPDTQFAATTIRYGVSANLGDPSDRYFAGAGNASAAIEVGDGYMIVADDESNVLRLYNESQSTAPVKLYDFTAQLPFGSGEGDFESASRVGNTIYWLGSMSNNSSGNLAPSRSTLFATTVSGSGAATTLTYAGAYEGLQTDLVNWDVSNGNTFGFAGSVHDGIGSHEPDAFNVEGMEFAGSSPSTVYLGFRAPLTPTSDRHLALVVPVTNIDQLVAGTATSATFGTPMQWDLGGLGIRDIRKNADGQYLIIAGTADDSNSVFNLYTWDGNPSDPPLLSNSLPLVPAGANQGSWETIVNVPDPLVGGSNVQLIEDNGDTAWYADSATEKNGLQTDLQKDLGRTFSYTAPTLLTTSTSLSISDAAPPIGEPVTYTATVTTNGLAPTGTVAFADNGTDIPACSAQPVDSSSGLATCDITYAQTGDHSIVATYSGTSVLASSSSSPTPVSVTTAAATLTLGADNNPAVTGQSVTISAVVGAPQGVAAAPTGTVEFLADGTDVPGCSTADVVAGTASCAVPAGFATGSHSITALYSGDGTFSAGGGAPLALVVNPAETSTALSVDNNPAVTGQPVTFTAVVSVNAPGSSGVAALAGTVEFKSGSTDLPGCGAVGIDASGTAQCAVTAGFAPSTPAITATYSGDPNFGSSGSGPLTETVTADATTVAVTASANPPVAGQGVTYTATVNPVGPGGGIPTGTVTFTVTGPRGAAPSCTAGNKVTLSGGVAQCAIPASKLVAGSNYAVTAVYSGDGGYLGSTGSLSQTIAMGTTKTTVSSSANPATIGSSVTLRAVVAAVSPATGTPTGSVTFTITSSRGTHVSCAVRNTVNLSGGAANCTVPAGTFSASGGPYAISVRYSGSPSFAPSTGILNQQVSKASATVAILQLPRSTTASGQSVTFAALVSPASPSRVRPTGTVSFTVTGAHGASVRCNGGGQLMFGSLQFCTVPAGVLVASGGPYTVTVSYSGDSNYLPAIATAIHQVTTR